MFKHFKPHKLTAQPASCWAGFANHLRNTAALNFLAWPQTRRKQRLAASVSQVVPHHAIFMTWMLPKAGGCYWREQTCWVNQVAVPEFLPNISSGLILTGLCGQDVLCSDGAGIGTSLRWNLCQGVPPSQPPAFSNLSNIRLQHRKEPLILRFSCCFARLEKWDTLWHIISQLRKPRSSQRKGLVPWRRKGISTATRVATHQSEEPSIGPPIAGEESPIFHMIR